MTRASSAPSKNKPQSKLNAIMQKGQKHVRVTKETTQLLKTLSANDHKRIAAVIRRWLDETEAAKK